MDCKKAFGDTLFRPKYFEKVKDSITGLISKSNSLYKIKSEQLSNLNKKFKQCVTNNYEDIKRSLAKPYILSDLLNGKICS